jgi:hypothetical protein
MPTDASLQALRDANPRHRTGLGHHAGRYEALRARITAAPPPAPPAPRRRPVSRLRVAGLAAAGGAVAAAAVLLSFALTAASPPSAYAAAETALTATTRAISGTETGTVTQGGSSYTLDTTRWHGTRVAVTRGQRSSLGPDRQLLLIGRGVFVQAPGGGWLHYSSVAAAGPKLGEAVQLARDNAAGTTARQILRLATGLRRTTRADGVTIYTGVIPDSGADPGLTPTAGQLMRVIDALRSGNEPGGPGGYHQGLALRMTVGAGGLVRQVSLTFTQHGTATATRGSAQTTWRITYSDIGSTPSVTPPATAAR